MNDFFLATVKRLKILLGALCLALFACAAAAEAPRYSVSVVPQYSAIELHKDWFPLLARISKDTGFALELKLAASIPLFEAGFLKGEPDFAYLNPYHAVMAKKAQAYVPLWHDSRPLSGILLVRKDSPYQTLKDLKDLKGLKIAFPAPNAFGASLYMRALLTEEAGIAFEQDFVKTHPNVIRHVIRQEAAAGGSIASAFEDEGPEVRAQLRIIYQTPKVASHPLVAHPRVPEEVQKKLTQAFLALTQDEEGRTLLKNIRTPAPEASNYPRDYLPLEKLNIKKYLILE